MRRDRRDQKPAFTAEMMAKQSRSGPQDHPCDKGNRSAIRTNGCHKVGRHLSAALDRLWSAARTICNYFGRIVVLANIAGFSISTAILVQRSPGDPVWICFCTRQWFGRKSCFIQREVPSSTMHPGMLDQGVTAQSVHLAECVHGAFISDPSALIRPVPFGRKVPARL